MDMTNIQEGQIVRQGDVILVKAKLPESVSQVDPREDGKTILAYGEVTGHHHRLEGATTLDFGLDDHGMRMIRVSEPTPLYHEEHSAPVIVGDFYAHVQQEWTDEEVVSIAD